jgi:4-amino-4-deoxy-L-arabinose transferase-like glycosyltransferase
MQSSTEPSAAKRTDIAWLGLICLGIVVNCFFLLSSGELRDWDEARHGVSAYEMVQSGNFLINTYNYKPDYWNAKPPLSFWSVALGYKLFGFNPLGLRFFSALFSCLTLFATLIYCYKRISPRVAIFTGFVLLSLAIFFQYHNARTGDPDALFLLFYIVGLLIVLAWPKRYVAYQIASFLAGLAFLTKSFHAIPMVLLLLIFFFMDFPLSRQSLKQATVCLLIALVPVALWGVARFQFDGIVFFERMIFYDLLKRATETIEGHVGGPLYYVKFVARHYLLWVLITTLVVGTILVLRIRSRHASPLALMPLHPNIKVISKLVLAATLPLLLYSLSASKLPWYSYPAFPFLAILFGVFLERAYVFMEIQSKKIAKVFILCVLVAAVWGEYRTLRKIYRHSVQQNLVQDRMMELGKISANRGAVLFLDAGDWRPSDVLAARLYGDFQLMQGGTFAYESAGNAKKRFLLSRTEKTSHAQSSQ